MRLPLCPDPTKRAVPIKNLSFRHERVSPALKQEVGAWFTHEIKDGYNTFYSKVHEIRSRTDDDGIKYLSVDGIIVTNLKTQIGDFHRAIYDDLDGIKVNHDGFDIYTSFQGSGIGSKFISSCFGSYKAAGVDRVAVYASDVVGGFAWARMGFRIRNDTTRHTVIKWMLSRVRTATSQSPLSTSQKNQVRSEIDRLLSASENGKDIQPCHVAEIGEETCRWSKGTMWPGKKALLNYGAWDGVYYFDGRQK